ncbi:MAG: acyl carrier protein [Ruminococcaceae bacterium]|nr:acyl carrier protein [Oscillospiraceae bacterium]
MTDIRKILYEICEDERVFDEETDLIESGLLDSYAVIELFCRLEDEGTELQITQIDRELLRTANGIEELIAKAK